MSADKKPRVDEEEDLEDLDDVLDQFSPSAQPASPPRHPRSGGAFTSTQPAAQADEVLTEDFSAKLSEGMASLFKELGIDSGAGSQGAEQERLAAAWEAMLVEGMDTMSDSSGAHASTEDDFRFRVRSTMNKLKESESGLKSSDSIASGGDETFQSLLSQLEGLGDLPGDGADSGDQIQGVLEAMMGQLMSKDVLYEPLKELHDKFPGYLVKNNSTISPEDKKRFDAQILCIKQLLDEFDAKTYRDEDEKARDKIVELMSELQAHGSPPEEIMGPLPPGFSMGADGLPNMPDGCDIS